MSSESCRRAVQAFTTALSCYLRSNALRTLKIASLTGQDKVKISLRAFMRCHDPSSGFAKVEEVVNTLAECEGSWIEKLGWGHTLEGGELYFIVPLKDLMELVRCADTNELANMLLKKILGT